MQLNSKSTLLYPHEFTGDSRSVFLLGEANFKVKPDKKRPFIVKSNDLQITALGTEFNVSAYPESQEIATTLISGSIRVDYNNLTTSVILHPNEQFAYNRNNKKYDLSNPDMDDVTAWQRGELVLQKMTLTDIINVLERKYPYAFVYSIKNLKKDSNTGVVYLDVLNNVERISDHCSNIAARLVGMEAGEDYDSHTLKNMMHHNPTKEYMLNYEQCRKDYLIPLEQLEA